MKTQVIFRVLALIIAVLSVSVAVHTQATKVIFEASLTPGLFPTPSEAGFVKGLVKVYANHSIEVSIVGAQPYESYYVYGGILFTYTTGDEISWAPVAGGPNATTLQLTTDAKGKGTATGWLGVLESNPYIAVALDDADNEEGTFGPQRYVTGFRLGS